MISLQVATIVFKETVDDMKNKVEYGDNPAPQYGAGFFHTSTDSEGITNYYHAMWARDVGRGVMELARLGCQMETMLVARYFVSHINSGNRWARVIHRPISPESTVELDGNSWILSAICDAWKVNGMDKSVGKEFCEKLSPVVDWVDSLVRVSPYSGLLPSMSELSGNPTTRYNVYPIFANYGMMISMRKFAFMAGISGNVVIEEKCHRIEAVLKEALHQLVSDGKFSRVPEGCWFNALDGREHRAFDNSDWGVTSWPIWHWTRQLPFIQDFDDGWLSPERSEFYDINMTTYELIRHYMADGEYFRKYGFVSNTGWSGMAGRHDETMTGYGQGFFTQAALMCDDVNVYGKCLEGIARLGYDGNVIEKLAHDRSPFIVQECYNYENYENALDHAFGVRNDGGRELKDNPGDEGNLAQEAEIVKVLSLVVGITCKEGKLIIMPRLPWLWDGMEVKDYPYWDENGKMHRINISFKHERWLGRTDIHISGIDNVKGVDVRFGPYPVIKGTSGTEVETIRNASWVWKRDLQPKKGIVNCSVSLQ